MSELDNRIRDAIFGGRKIEAIKLHREQTGLGLKESKAVVEKWEAELRTSSPDQFINTPGKGCLPMIVAAALAGAVLWRMVA